MTTEAGLMLIDKSVGDTSHDAVLRVRRALGLRRVGHTGTLDPFATGLLLALVGPFTRLAELFHVLPKDYEATMELGRQTDTDDLTGATVKESPEWQAQTPEAIRGAFALREGTGLQMPPAFSAKRVAGQRAHAVARRGGRVELAPKRVTFHELEVTSVDLPQVRFRARVSTGAYIRALARDIGHDLGCGGHLTRLRRTAIGPFVVEDAVAADDIHADAVRSTRAWCGGADAVSWLPRRYLSGDEWREIVQGRSVERGELAPAEWPAAPAQGSDGEAVALVAESRLVGIAEPRGGRLLPRKVFAS